MVILVREIKFRAWDKENKVMIYPKGILFDGRVVNFNCGILEPFEEYELMQFTGLYDKNGKEIYEGDIIKYSFDGKKAQSPVFFLDGCFSVHNKKHELYSTPCLSCCISFWLSLGIKIKKVN